MRSLLKEWLSEAGHRVSAALPAEAAAPSAADLIIVSLYMPKNGGVHLVRKIHAAHPGVPVIALSGQFRSGLSTDGATAQALGVQQVIAKPLARADLLEAIRAIISIPNRPGA
jgi:DNA-binding response OmpR family regulator